MQNFNIYSNTLYNIGWETRPAWEVTRLMVAQCISLNYHFTKKLKKELQLTFIMNKWLGLNMPKYLTGDEDLCHQWPIVNSKQSDKTIIKFWIIYKPILNLALSLIATEDDFQLKRSVKLDQRLLLSRLLADQMKDNSWKVNGERDEFIYRKQINFLLRNFNLK